MGIIDKLKGELVDIIEWIDDSSVDARLAVPPLQQRDQERRRADRPRGPAGGVRLPGPARRQVRARALRAEDREPADPRHAAGLEARLQQPVPQRGLLHQHPPGHRPALGHAHARSPCATPTSAWSRSAPTACACVRIADPRSSSRGHRHRQRGRGRGDRRAAAPGDHASRSRTWCSQTGLGAIDLQGRQVELAGKLRDFVQERVDDEFGLEIDDIT